MRKNEVRIINEAGKEATVIKSAFEKVWAKRGWAEKEAKKIEAEVVAEVEELTGDGTPPANPPVDPPVKPSAPAARLGKADGGTGAVESTQTTS